MHLFGVAEGAFLRQTKSVIDILIDNTVYQNSYVGHIHPSLSFWKTNSMIFTDISLMLLLPSMDYIVKLKDISLELHRLSVHLFESLLPL